MPEQFVCPHCEDHGFVSLPKRYHRRETVLGHEPECDCMDCRYAGAHRMFFQELPEGADPSRWRNGRETHPCRFCAQGERYRAWLREVLHTHNAPSRFAAAPRGYRTFPATPEERDRIAAGIAWDRAHPVINSQPRRPERPVPAMPDTARPLDDFEVSERKQELRRQAEALGATTTKGD